MSPVLRFLVFNLLVGLAGGGLAWLIVFAGIPLLNVRSSRLSLCFLSLPVLKSMQVQPPMSLCPYRCWPTRITPP